MSKKKSNTGKPEVHKDLEGLDISINEFGEIVTNYQIEKINEFLNENVADKKLKDTESDAKLEEE
ncbi:MAG: hypothetical protein ACI8P3_003056 [Saprospiraceae bacterium]|jgi:hypothetical protein